MAKQGLAKKCTIRTIGIVSCASMLAAGCGNDGGANASQTASPSNQKAPEKPAELSIMLSPTGEAPKPDSAVKAELEKMSNTKLNFTFVPRPAYPDKFNVMLASGEMPNAVLALNQREPGVENAIESGVFWEIGPYLKDYPNLSKLNPQALENARVNGKNYGLIRSRGLGLHGIIYRKDWLNKLGLQEPKTLDDLYNVMKAFTLNDPDGNGKADTYGLVESKDLVGFEDISIFFGAPNKWGIVDGKAVPAFMTKEYMDAMKFFKRLYDEKLVNPNFAIMNSQQKKDEMKKGKAGSFVGPMALMTSEIIPQRVQKEAQFDVLNTVEGPNGKKAISTPGFYGAYLFPKSSNKTEADLKKALKFFDTISSPEGMDLIFYGLKNDYYHLEEGKVVKNPDKEKIAQIDQEFNQLQILPETIKTPLKLTPEEQKVEKAQDENQKIGVANKAISFASKTYKEKGTELDKIVTDSTIKFIMGQLDENGWNKAVEDWKKAGGEQVIKEYSGQIAAK